MKKWEIQAIKRSKKMIRGIRMEVSALNSLLDNWEKVVEKKEANDNVIVANFDQAEYDRMCNAVTKQYKAMAKILGFRSAHDILKIIEDGYKKAWNGENYI